jgi:hypothetical protein
VVNSWDFTLRGIAVGKIGNTQDHTSRPSPHPRNNFVPRRSDLHKILIIGSGPIVIGQACEFDYSGTQACKALREEGYEVVLVNSNPATIMTDPGTADRTYIEPLTWEVVEKVIAAERPDALLPTLGGQTGLNLAMDLVKAARRSRKSGCPVSFGPASRSAAAAAVLPTTAKSSRKPCAAGSIFRRSTKCSSKRAFWAGKNTKWS